jgi:Zn-dependent protease
MNGSARLGRIAGIELKVHWTFLLLLAYVAGVYWLRGGSLGDALLALLFVLAVFGCIVLHELGHALTARRYGIATHDITLLPIGGVARLEEIPEEPWKEFWIAVAGPLVNVAIAAVLAVVLVTMGRLEMPATVAAVSAGAFMLNLLSVNLFLVLFNAIPAFPMDGGRVLRALLATRLPRHRATDIAANVGQFVAVMLGVYGLFTGQLMLVLIGIFVYFGAEAEARTVRVKSMLADLPVSKATISEFQALAPSDTLRVAGDRLLRGAQQDFPIVVNGRLAGMLYRSDLIRGIQERGEESLVGDSMRVDLPAVAPTDELHEALLTMRELNLSTLPVMVADDLKGIVTQENIGELLMMREAQAQSASQRRAAPASDGSAKAGWPAPS